MLLEELPTDCIVTEFWNELLISALEPDLAR